MTPIPFNKPFIAGKELYYIAQAVTMGNLGGDGHFTKKCSEFLRDSFAAEEVLMTPSCTAALEMAAILCDLKPGDEVIMPSYTFVSTANAFVRVGATPVFVDIRPDTLNLDETLIEDAITDRTRVIVPVHYAGVGCEMDRIMAIAERHNLLVVEDAAQGVNAKYKGQHLGTIGHLGCYSFHETKNYICGEGGALAINASRFLDRARIIRDKGTNRHEFFAGQVDKYTWVDVGSSYVPSELCCAFLWGQLEQLHAIADHRMALWSHYYTQLSRINADDAISLPHIPADCEHNGHLFYILFSDKTLKEFAGTCMSHAGITAPFHFVPLHSSPIGLNYNNTRLTETDRISSQLIRLPMYAELEIHEQERILSTLIHAMAGPRRSDSHTFHTDFTTTT